LSCGFRLRGRGHDSGLFIIAGKWLLVIGNWQGAG
jgi:hypothetical protein